MEKKMETNEIRVPKRELKPKRRDEREADDEDRRGRRKPNRIG